MLGRLIALNALGRWLPLAANILSVPLYTHLLGLEQYAMVGLFAIALAAAGLVDGPLGTALARHLSAASSEAAAARAFSTMETAYLAAAAVLLASALAVAPALASAFANLAAAQADGAAAFAALGAAVVVRLLVSFYGAALLGRDRQVALNGLYAGTELARHAVSVAALFGFSSDALTFFAAQIAVYGASALLHRRFAAPAGAALFALDRTILWEVVRSGGRIGATAVSFFLVNNVDKFALSGVLDARTFGLYVLCHQISMNIAAIHQPVYFAAFPRLARLDADGREALAATFHAASRASSGLAAAAYASLVLCVPFLFPLFLDAAAVGPSQALVALGGIGLLAHGPFNIVFALQIAARGDGHTRVSNFAYAAASGTTLLAFGAQIPLAAAAAVFSGAYVLLLAASAPVTLARVLPGELPRWALRGVLLPWTAVLLPAALLAAAVRPSGDPATDAAAALAMSAVFMGAGVIGGGLWRPRVADRAMARLKEAIMSPEVRSALRRVPGYSGLLGMADWVADVRWRAAGALGAAPAWGKRRLIASLAVRHGLTWFVETGTFLGDTTAALAPLCRDVDTIEVSPRLQALAVARFSRRPHIRCHLGDSATVLPQVLSRSSAPALFWLDGHFSGGFTGRSAGDTPVVAEIKTIAARNQPQDVILVDDARLFGTDPAYPSRAELEALAAGFGRTVRLEGDIFILEPAARA